MSVLRILGVIILASALAVLIVMIAVVLFLNFSPSVGKMPDAKERQIFASKSGHYTDGAFRNENEVRTLTGEKREVVLTSKV